MSQKSPQMRALTRMPTAGARSWSGYISRADGGGTAMKGARAAPPACEAVSMTGSHDGLAGPSGDPCRQSRTSTPPVMGLSIPPRARGAAHDDQLPSRSGRRSDSYSIPIRIGKFIRRQLTQHNRVRPDRSILSRIPHPAAGVRPEWRLGMKPTSIRRRTVHRTAVPPKPSCPKRPELAGIAPACVAQLLHNPCRSEDFASGLPRRYTVPPSSA